jgi:phage gp36-like protein
MAIYFSSEATIEAKVKAARVKLWGDRDRDNTVDPATLAAALRSARNRIVAKLTARYGAGVIAWSIADCPPILTDISDDLAIYFMASGSGNALSPQIQTNYDNAIALLTELADGTAALIGSDDSITSADTSSSIAVSTEDRDRQFPRDLLETAPSALYPRNKNGLSVYSTETTDDVIDTSE